MTHTAQPAIKSYFFGKGYRDLGATIQKTWHLNLQTARDFKTKASTFMASEGIGKFGAVACYATAFSVVFFGTFWFLLLSGLHISILIIFFSIIYLGFSAVLVTERSYLLLRRVFTACPHCHSKSKLPVYICSGCGARHDQLIPGSYGILKRTCNCGQKLPTTFFNGRSKLAARCASCNRSVETSESTPLCIPIIGGPSVGKTCYLFAATKVLIEDIAPQRGWSTRFINNQTENLYQHVKTNFNAGKPPNKTTDRQAKAFNFFLSGNFSPDKIIYLYDSAGEAFEGTNDLKTHKFYGYLHGFLFLIDPFSIPMLANRYQGQFDENAVKPSRMNLEDVYDAMIINLEKNHKIKRSQKINRPCAVVINKIDVLDLESFLGDSAVAAYQKKHKLPNIQRARDMLCRELLEQYNFGNFARKLEAKFNVVRFFTCAALGETNGIYKPRRVAEPITWLLGKADRDLRP